MAKIVNNVNLDLQETSAKKARENNNSIPVSKTITGVFNLSGSPMFTADLKTETSAFPMGCDEPTVLGGQGIQPTPLTYILYGIMACYSSTLAAECALDGLVLSDLKIRGTLDYDIGTVVTGVKSQIIKGLKLEVLSSTKLEKQIKNAWVKCPAVYAIQNPIDTEIVQASE